MAAVCSSHVAAIAGGGVCSVDRRAKNVAGMEASSMAGRPLLRKGVWEMPAARKAALAVAVGESRRGSSLSASAAPDPSPVVQMRGRGGPDGDGYYTIAGNGGFLTISAGKIITADAGSNWILEEQPDGSYKIIAPKPCGPKEICIQVLSPLEPVFEASDDIQLVIGNVRVHLSATATWRIAPAPTDGGWIITADRTEIPPNVNTPDLEGEVYLVAEGQKVLWKFSGCIPEGALWTFQKLE